MMKDTEKSVLDNVKLVLDAYVNAFCPNTIKTTISYDDDNTTKISVDDTLLDIGFGLVFDIDILEIDAINSYVIVNKLVNDITPFINKHCEDYYLQKLKSYKFNDFVSFISDKFIGVVPHDKFFVSFSHLHGKPFALTFKDYAEFIDNNVVFSVDTSLGAEISYPLFFVDFVRAIGGVKGADCSDPNCEDSSCSIDKDTSILILTDGKYYTIESMYVWSSDTIMVGVLPIPDTL